ncbi:hypothetical protein IMZ48_19540, partial [Candidatus Bathyarchaeota archaeon]|nr:hypothetical protein [Candidatus Bathyarchaeota archaeon]
MPPAQRKRVMEDDFVYTISDSEGVPDEEEAGPQPPPKKKNKANKKKKGGLDAESEVPEGLWGQNEEDDGAMNSDFEFAPQGVNDFDMDEFAGWGFEGVKGHMDSGRKGVDLDAIIARRRGEDEEEGEPNEDASEDGGADEVANDMDIDLDLDDADDEILADDAFGMGADSEEEESDVEAGEEGEEKDENDEEDGSAFDEDDDDDESVGSMPHIQDSDVEDDEDDEEEQAKRDAFFAPEAPASKQDVGGRDTFQTMSLSRPVVRGLAAAGYTQPTPIQTKT